MNQQMKHIITDAFYLLVASTIFVTTVNWLFADLKKGKPQHDLTVAVLQQDLTEVRTQLKENPQEQVQFQDDNGRTALMWASYAYIEDPELFVESQEKRVALVLELLEYSDDCLQIKDNDGWTALSWAAWSGLQDVVGLLLNKGAEVDAVDKNGYTPLMLAALRGNDQVIQQLLTEGADANRQNNAGQTALKLAQVKAQEYPSSNFQLSIDRLEKHTAQ